MISWELPTALEVHGTYYSIRTDFRVVLDILAAFNDPDLDDYAKTEVMIRILYEQYETILEKDLQEAAERAAEFIDCGLKAEERNAVRTMDWEQDAGIILPAINRVAGREIRSEKYLHWWTFMGYFMEIGDSVFSTVQGIRYKKAKRRPLEKWEKEFLKNNRALVELKEKYSEEEIEEQERLMRLLD